MGLGGDYAHRKGEYNSSIVSRHYRHTVFRDESGLPNHAIPYATSGFGRPVTINIDQCYHAVED